MSQHLRRPWTPRRLDRRGVARIRPVFTALLAGGVTLVLALAGSRWLSRLHADLARARVDREATSIAATLESVIARRMVVLYGLATFLRLRWDTDDLEGQFDRFADGLRVGAPGIRTMQYVVDGVIVHTWPLEGNESAIGRDLAADPRPDVLGDYLRAVESRTIVASGPFQLFQDGNGVVGRLAVRNAADSVVALAAVVIDFGILLHESGVSREGRPLTLQLRNSTDSLLWHSGASDAPLQDPVRVNIRLPDRDWRIEAVPRGGWAADAAGGERTYWLIAALGVVLVSGLAWLLQAWQRARIQSAHLRELHRVEETFRQLFQLVPDGVLVSRASTGEIIEVNDAYCRLVQQSRHELIGKPIPAAAVWASLEEREAALEVLRTEGALQEYPFLLKRKDGTEREAVLSARGVMLHDEACNLAVVRDVHERVRLERRLAQGQRLEAVGRLAGGIAHDFNNLITGIRGYADLLLDALPAPDDRRTDLLEIQRASSRAAELTRQLLTFARRQVVTPRLVDLNRLIDGAEPLLTRLTGNRITLVVERSPHPVPVAVDPAQFEQVLTNLTVNACDASPDGGRVVISTALEDRSVVLAIRDDGVGIPPEALPHLFEPFYTTKPDGKGTGLGLATVYGIVAQAEGRIDVQSEVGVGTTVRIVLPRAEGALPDEVSISGDVPLPRGHETVLVVDDEPQIRELSVRLLRRLGYRVIAVRDGHAALAALANAPDVALVLTDVVMPGMGGTELVGLLVDRHPRLRVVLMSGYSEELAVSGHVGVSFLAKPFTAAELAAVVRSTLDA